MVCEALHKLSCLIYSFLISLRPHSVLWAIPWTNQAHSTLKSLQWLLPFPWMLFLDFLMAAAAVKSLQLCPTLCDPWTACSPPGSPVLGILQARTMEWVAIAFSNAWKWKVKVKSPSRVWLFETHGLHAAHQVPPPWDFPARVLEWVPWPSLSSWLTPLKSLFKCHLLS